MTVLGREKWYAATLARVRLVAIDTSSPLGSVALFEEGELLDEETHVATNGHGESLLSSIDGLLKRHAWEPGSVERWAVDVGPGSFTGLRVGLGTVKGILLVTGAELAAVTSLDALAYGLPVEDLVVSMIEAGKGEFFLQAKKGGQTLIEPSNVRAQDVGGTVEAIERAAPGPRVVVAGRAAATIEWPASIAPKIDLRDGAPNDCPRASAVGRLGSSAAAVTDRDALEPLYVRPPDITMPKPRPPR
jgi:tRNA threonylcarbamoyladenosine biosynthesis protein TsaB